MESALKSTTGTTLELARELPNDLRAWLGERQLMDLALEAVQTVTLEQPTFGGQRGEQLSSQMMLTLLTYCYATDTYGSEDVEWSAENEFAPGYICAHTRPDWQTVRRFRKANRARIEECLVQVLNRAVTRRFTDVGVEDPWSRLVEVDLLAETTEWARRKIQLAILMDTAASD